MLLKNCVGRDSVVVLRIEARSLLIHMNTHIHTPVGNGSVSLVYSVYLAQRTD